MEKTPQRALKCLVTQTGIHTHLYTHSTHAHAYIHTRTHIHTWKRNTAAHTKTIHHNSKQTIQTPAPQPTTAHPNKQQQNYFMNPPTKAIPIHQSLYHSTKASVSYSLPPAHRTAPLLYAAAHKPAQHRSCIGTLHQEQNNKKNKQTQSVKILNTSQPCW